jgi:hypothetical protein
MCYGNYIMQVNNACMGHPLSLQADVALAGGLQMGQYVTRIACKGKEWLVSEGQKSQKR